MARKRLESTPVVFGEPVHELHGQVTRQIDRLAPLVGFLATAFLCFDKTVSRKVANELFLGLGRQAPEVAGFDNESHLKLV